METSEFKLGDIIIGNSKANRYFTTTKEGWIGIVVKINDDETMAAIGYRHDDSASARCYDGLPFDCFDLYDDHKAKYVSLW